MALYSLGEMYSNGEGVTQDYVEAHMFYNVASSVGETRARKNRDEIAKQMTPDQIAEAQLLAREWTEKYQQ